MQDPDHMVNTGFIMSTSKNLTQEEEACLRRTQIITNEYVNLLFERQQDRKDGKVDLHISGRLFRTFSEIDLFELKKVSEAILHRKRMPSIDMKAIVSIFEGHTIFSIFQEHIDVYEQILYQLQQREFPSSEDFNGLTAENPYLRRLHRILLIPTSDWVETKDIRRKLNKRIGPESFLNKFA